MNARETALLILIKLDRDNSYVNALLNSSLGKSTLSDVDRSFVRELVLGCVKNRYLIDYVIMQFSKVKIKKMSTRVRNILELGVYQMLFLTRIPNSAAINECVKLSKKYAVRSSGFVNGVLRGIARGRDDIRMPDRSANELEYLSVMYSFPMWIVRRLSDDYGNEFCESILEAANKTYSPYIRVNRLKAPKDSDEFIGLLSRDNINVTPVDGIDFAYSVRGKIDIGASDTYKDGLYTLQNKSSQLASIILDPRPGDTVIDMCAAPGGKSTHMAELMDNSGTIYAFDIHEHKIPLIENAAKRLGIDIIKASKGNSSVLNKSLIGVADRVLLDAPCSGLGVMHIKPDIKWHRNDMDIDALTELQANMLQNAALYVKKGGYIVYSTCTILKDENERQIAEFLRKNKNFRLVDERQLFTHRDGGSGFYIAKLEKV